MDFFLSAFHICVPMLPTYDACCPLTMCVLVCVFLSCPLKHVCSCVVHIPHVCSCLVHLPHVFSCLVHIPQVCSCLIHKPCVFLSCLHSTCMFLYSPLITCVFLSYPQTTCVLFLFPPKGGRGCLMSPPCLESQGYELIPLFYLIFGCLMSPPVWNLRAMN